MTCCVARLVFLGFLLTLERAFGFQQSSSLQTTSVGATRIPAPTAGNFTPKFKSPLTLQRAQYMATEPSQQDGNASNNNKLSLRDKLRKATGFSLTAFRAALRAATGISLTAVYGTAVAVSGLWIRKATSVVLSLFPAWFRYFLQPFLVLYYFPIFIIRGLTGPTRKEAKAKHMAVKESWRDALDFARTTEVKGYWPVQVNEDGDFELVSPPTPSDKEDLADAVADSVEQAMENGYKKRSEDGLSP